MRPMKPMRNIRNALDLPPLLRSPVSLAAGFPAGFDSALSLFDALGGEPGKPAYDIERIGDKGYRITLAAAGFSPDDLKVETRGNLLIVRGERKEEQKRKDDGYIYHGIALSDFERSFGLADNVRVTAAKMKDGMLTIDLVREVPEKEKPREIKVAS